MARQTVHAAAAAAVLLAVALLTCGPTPTDALLNNTITQWVNETRQTARTQGLPNTHAIVEYAYLTSAIYRALQAGGAPEDALAAYAAHTVSATRYPVLQPRFDKLLSAQLAGVSQADREKAYAIAAPIAQNVIIERVNDPFYQNKPYKTKAAGTPFAYQLGPNQTFSLTPQLGDSIPWVWPADKLLALTENKDPSLSGGKVFEPPKDIKEYEHVARVGERNTTARNKYQTDSADFWALGAAAGLAGTSSSVSGLWLEIASRVVPENLSLKETAELWAKIGASLADGYIACWQLKYRTDFWRPRTALRTGVPGSKLKIDNWEPYLPDANFQEYPSGHQCATGSALGILWKYFGGKDDFTFTITSDGAPWVGPRTYKKLSEAAAEAADSRVFGGVHFNSSSYDGQDLGVAVANYVWDNFKGSPAALGKAQPLCAEVGKAAPSDKGDDNKGSGNKGASSGTTISGNAAVVKSKSKNRRLSA